MILEISIGLLLIWFLISSYVIWNLNAKQEVLEVWIESFIQVIEKVNIELNQIDYLGAFEADDEVGTIFEEIKKIIKQLDRFKGEEDATKS
jgi:hypothetical protein|tara:strand:- start:72 stop:344 length:273 start_codon:yes stop_codon:yes gene_type:complete